MIDNEATERFMAAPWLAEVDSDTKRTILKALVEARAPAGVTLLAQGQPNDHLTFLIEGTAEIERTFAHRPPRDPHDIDRAGRFRHDVVFSAEASERHGSRDLGSLDALALPSGPRGDAYRQSTRRRSAGPGRRPRPLRTVRPDGQVVHQPHVPASRRARQDQRVGRISRQIVRGARHLRRPRDWSVRAGLRGRFIPDSRLGPAIRGRAVGSEVDARRVGSHNNLEWTLREPFGSFTSNRSLAYSALKNRQDLSDRIIAGIPIVRRETISRPG